MGGREAMPQIVKQPYYLKPMPANPYLGLVHDGTSTGYMEGFSVKPMNHIYRYRYNLFPVGQSTGMYGRNKWAKHVHWLEVSTIERMRVQIFGEEAIPMFWLSLAVFAFTFYHCYRLGTQHSDATMYFATGPFTKHAVKMTRFSRVRDISEPVPYKYFQRAPEWFTYDAYKELVQLGVIANDPFLELLKEKKLVDEAIMPSHKVVRRGYGDVLYKLFGDWSGNHNPRDRPESVMPGI